MLFAAMLAYAERSDQSTDLMVLILEALGVIAGVAVAAAVPLFVATGRRAVRPDYLAPMCLMWGASAGGGWLYLLIARYRWNAEYQKLVMSGFFDPANTGTRPAMHPAFVLILAAGYLGLIAAATMARRRAPGFPVEAGEPPRATPHRTNGHPRE